MNPISPFILQAQISPPAGGGSFGLADTTRLENPFQAPMWIDEIRFRLPNSVALPISGEAWSQIRIELKLGNVSLTKDFVPISMFGKQLNASIDGNYIWTWKLPKPLFVPARELLRPTAYYEPYTGAPARTLNIMYCCRPLPKNTPTPEVVQIPWVTYFKPPFSTVEIGGGVDTTDQSTPADLYNPWDEELHVQRFVGQLLVQKPTASGVNDGFIGLSSAFVDFETGLVSSGTLVSAQDSFNNILIRDRTPFAHVFDFVDRAWTVNCVLPPKGFYLFTIDRLWANYDSANQLIATTAISMVGWREVQVRR